MVPPAPSPPLPLSTPHSQIALLAAGSMAAALPYTTAVYVLVSAAWIRSTMELADDMEGATGEAVVSLCCHERGTALFPGGRGE